MDYSYITDILERNIQKSHTDLCILRWMRREQLQASLIDGNPGTSSQIVLSGVGCRSLINGSWGFASSTDIDDIKDIIATSERFAQYKSGHTRVPPLPAYTVGHVSNSEGLHLVDEFFELSREAHDTIKGVPTVLSSRIGILLVQDMKTTVTTDAVTAETYEPRILGSVTVVAKSGDHLCHYTEVVGGGYGFSTLESQLIDAAQKAVDTALLRLRGKPPPSGLQNVLLGGEVVGLLAHEAVGHAAEADIAERGSFLSGKTGEYVASPSVTIVDDATYDKGFGTIHIDDEGVMGKKTPIIEQGVLSHFLHNRETAYKAETEPTGNARAWLYSREPQIRMTNTFLLPGDATLEELTQEVKNGVYIQGSEGGNANPDGSFMVIATLAQKIEKGALTDEYYMGPVIIGDAAKIFQTIEVVGDQSTFVMTPSMCGKGGSAFVGQGGPALASELFLGGPS